MANIINIFSNTKYEMNDSSSCCIIGQLVRQFINLSPDLSLKFNNVVFMDETEADRCVTKSFVERFNEYIYLYRSADDPTPMKCRFNGKTDQLPKLEVVKYASTGISENDEYDMNQLVNVSDVRAYVPARKIKMTMMNVDLPQSVVLDYKTKTVSQKEIVSQIVNRKVAPFIYRYTLPEKYTDSSVPDTDVTIDITLDSATNVKNVYVSADIPSTSKSYSNQYVPMIQNDTTNTTYGENKNLLVKVDSNNKLSFEMNNIPDNIDLLITGYTNELYSYSVCGNYLVSIRDENNTAQYIMADNNKINGSERHSDDTSATYGNTTLYDPDDNYISPQSWATTPINSNNINITAYIDTNYVSRLYLKGVILYSDNTTDTMWPSNIDNSQGSSWTNWSLPGVSTLNINGNINTKKQVAYINIFAYGATQTINVQYVKNSYDTSLNTQSVNITYNDQIVDLYESGTSVSFNMGTICDIEISYAGTLQIYTQLLCNGKVIQTLKNSEIDQTNRKITFKGVKLTDEISKLTVKLYSYVTKNYKVSWTKTWPNMYSAYNLYNKYENVNSAPNYNYSNIINITNSLSTTVTKTNSTYESENGENNVNVAVVKNNFTNYNFLFGNKKYLFFNNYVESLNSSTKYFIEDNYNLYVNNTNMSAYQVANKEAIEDAPNYSIDITKNNTITIEARYMNKQRYIRIFTNKEIASEYVYIYYNLLTIVNGTQTLVKSYKTADLVKYTKTQKYDIQYNYNSFFSLNTSNTYNTFVYVVPVPDNMTYNYVVFSFDDPNVSMSETPGTREQSVFTMIKGGLTYEDFSAANERPVLSLNTINLLQQNIYVPYHITEGNNDEAMHLIKLNVPYLYVSNENYKFIDYSIEFLENDNDIKTMKIYTTRGQLYMYFDGIFYELHKYDYDDTYEPAQENLPLTINKADLNGEYEYRIPVKTGVPYQLYTFYFKPEYKNESINTTNYTILVDAMYGYHKSLQDDDVTDADHLNSNIGANMAFQVEIDTRDSNFKYKIKGGNVADNLCMSIRAYIAYQNLEKPELDDTGGTIIDNDGNTGGFDFIIQPDDQIYAE